MTAIDSSNYLSNNTTDVRKTGDKLGKDDFLKLFITQLQNQDPSSPTDNSQFISQMATFSTLEQMVNIGTKLDQIIANNTKNNLLNDSSLIGKEVTWQKTEGSGEAATVQKGMGVIQSVQSKDNKVTFLLEDGTQLDTENISQVNDSASSNSLVAGSELIGKLVTWKDATDKEVSAVVKSVLMSNGKLQYEVNDANGTKLSSNQLLKIASN